MTGVDVIVRVDSARRTYRLSGDGVVSCDELTEDHQALAIFAGQSFPRTRSLLEGLSFAVDNGYVTADTFRDVCRAAAKRGRVRALTETHDRRVLAVLAHDALWTIRRAVAQNPNCPSELLTRLLHDEEVRVRNASLRNPSLEGVDPALLSATDAASRLQGLTDPNELASYAKDPRVTVRRGMASNPAVPPGTLHQLVVDDDDVQIASRVALNPSTAPETLVMLVDRRGMGAHHAVRHPAFPVEVMRAHVEAGKDLIGFFNNPSCPGDLLELITEGYQQNPDSYACYRVAPAVAEHPNATERALRLVLTLVEGSPNEQQVRYAVAGHAAASAVLLQEMGVGGQNEGVA